MSAIPAWFKPGLIFKPVFLHRLTLTARPPRRFFWYIAKMMKVIWLLVLALAGCAGLPAVEPQALAQQYGFVVSDIAVDGFVLRTYQRVTDPQKPWHLYIEGDGRAWLSISQPSADPTPRQPVALQLAVRDPWPNVIYLARPCQYTLNKSPACQVEYWTSRRFSSDVIDSMNRAVEVLAQQVPRQPIHLIGYSGGGAVAVLLAARRDDIASLRTVAGNLDHVALNAHHKVSSMPGSLNAMDVAVLLKRLPQIHFVGGKDKVVPEFVAQNFVRATGSECSTLVKQSAASHDDGWVENWADLLKIDPVCLKS